jgi:DNA-binding MarR family transcriptional regulator
MVVELRGVLLVSAELPDPGQILRVLQDDVVRLVDPGASEMSRSVLDAVHRYEAADLQLRARLAARLGINTADLAALRHIQRREQHGIPVRVRDLEAWLHISNASASVVTNRLCKVGLIAKTPSTSDRRERVLHLTQQGSAQLAAAVGESPQALDALLDTVTTRESQRIVELLDAVTAVLQRTTHV